MFDDSRGWRAAASTAVSGRKTEWIDSGTRPLRRVMRPLLFFPSGTASDAAGDQRPCPPGVVEHFRYYTLQAIPPRNQ